MTTVTEFDLSATLDLEGPRAGWEFLAQDIIYCDLIYESTDNVIATWVESDSQGFVLKDWGDDVKVSGWVVPDTNSLVLAAGNN